jgi:hypothetical protein
LRVAVVHRGERGEAFLTGGVPDLKLDGSGRQIALLCEECGCLRVSLSP